MIKNVTPGSTVIDAGANIGYFTLLLGQLVGNKGEVISYEANSKNFELLKENVSYHVFGDRADIRNVAVYKKENELTFYSSKRWTGNGSLMEHNDEYFN